MDRFSGDSDSVLSATDSERQREAERGSDDARTRPVDASCQGIGDDEREEDDAREEQYKEKQKQQRRSAVNRDTELLRDALLLLHILLVGCGCGCGCVVVVRGYESGCRGWYRIHR